MSPPLAVGQGLEKSANPVDNQRARVAPDSAEKVVSRTRATPRPSNPLKSLETRNDEHSRGARSASCLALPRTLGALADRHNQHTPNTYTHSKHTHTHTLPPSSAPDFPHGTVTSGLPQPATDGHFRFPDSFGDREAVLPAPPGPQGLLLWGSSRKSAAPNSEFLGARRAGAGLGGREPSTQKSRRHRGRPGDRTAPACVLLRMRAHLGTAPPQPALFISPLRALKQSGVVVAAINA